MKNVFDFENTKIEVTGAHPLVYNDTVMEFILNRVNDGLEQRVEAGKSFAQAPYTKSDLAAKLIVYLDGQKPQKNPIVDDIVEALDALYDKTNINSVLTVEEDDVFIEYLAWLKGGLPYDGDIIPFVKPDENDLCTAALALLKMVRARA